MKSSPRLRILHFDLPIVDILPLSVAIGEPIALHELEVLNLGWSQKDGTEILFRWLAPSPKLRQFSFSSLRRFKDNPRFGHPATIAFLAGSGITVIHVHSLPPKEIIALVTPCSHVRDLACRGMLEYTDEIMPFQFNTLYLIECAIEVDSLRRLIQTIEFAPTSVSLFTIPKFHAIVPGYSPIRSLLRYLTYVRTFWCCWIVIPVQLQNGRCSGRVGVPLRH
ncbi:hypothetical protein RSAG8_10476, partial [Rhizoctonia solani AG-8 WAC10335]